MVSFLCTIIWLLSVEETRKSQSCRVIVMEMKVSSDKQSQVSTSRFLSAAVTCPWSADGIIPHGAGLSHVLDCSYSTHRPISTSLEA